VPNSVLEFREKQVARRTVFILQSAAPAHLRGESFSVGIEQLKKLISPSVPRGPPLDSDQMHTRTSPLGHQITSRPDVSDRHFLGEKHTGSRDLPAHRHVQELRPSWRLVDRQSLFDVDALDGAELVEEIFKHRILPLVFIRDVMDRMF
jgi:hypothetical protein